MINVLDPSMCQTGNQTQLNFTSHGILISCHKIMVFAPLQNHFVTLMVIQKHSTTVSHQDKVHFGPIWTYEGLCWEFKYPQTYFECLANNYKGGLFKLFKLNINRDPKFLPNFQIPVPRIQNALTMVSDLSIVRKQIYKKKHFFRLFLISVSFLSHVALKNFIFTDEKWLKFDCDKVSKWQRFYGNWI